MCQGNIEFVFLLSLFIWIYNYIVDTLAISTVTIGNFFEFFSSRVDWINVRIRNDGGGKRC